MILNIVDLMPFHFGHPAFIPGDSGGTGDVSHVHLVGLRYAWANRLGNQGMRRRDQVSGRAQRGGGTTKARVSRWGPDAKRRSQRLLVSVALCSFLLAMAIVVISRATDRVRLPGSKVPIGIRI